MHIAVLPEKRSQDAPESAILSDDLCAYDNSEFATAVALVPAPAC